MGVESPNNDNEGNDDDDDDGDGDDDGDDDDNDGDDYVLCIMYYCSISKYNKRKILLLGSLCFRCWIFNTPSLCCELPIFFNRFY